MTVNTIMNNLPRAYLGDSVYIEADIAEGWFVVYTDNGFGRSNEIFFETEVTSALIRFLTDHKIIKKER